MDTILDIENAIIEAEIRGEAKGHAEGLAEGEAKGHAEGHAEGKAEGKAEGLEIGRNEERYRMAKSFKDQGVAIEVISVCTGLTIDEISQL